MEYKCKVVNYHNGITGAQVIDNGILFHTVLRGKNSNGLLLYEKETGEVTRVDFDDSIRTGNVYHGMLCDLDHSKYHYMFHEDGIPVLDTGAKAYIGHRLFGAEHRLAKEEDAISGCVFVKEDFAWGQDQKPDIPYEDSVLYGMHVRGFTKDSSSRIKEAGTFAGVTKKISYLKKLGITGVVLQPIYETEECTDEKINYWGYLPGYYYAPKNAYSYSDNAVNECKEMIRELHKNKIEVFLQFYFPFGMIVSDMEKILVYWSEQYHVDGFQIMGPSIPYKAIGDSPYLSDLKIWADNFPYYDLSSTSESSDYFKKNSSELPKRRLATFNRDYMWTMRKFLKGDSGMLSGFLSQNRKNDLSHGDINYLSSYDGFRLMDVFSYDIKHNVNNGENNQDGEDYNCSWNCGAEGPTRKKAVVQLREKQFRNAWMILLSSQGTPFFFMGDEWGKTGLGNNNPYCQDNEITWQKWNLKKQEKDRLQYVTMLIAFRKDYKVLSQRLPLRNMDYLSCGYPDMSYHGKEAWKPDLEQEDRQLGILLCGNYHMDEKNKDKHIYLIYNMHWEKKEIAFPKLPKGMDWKLLIDTERNEKAFVPDGEENVIENQVVSIPGRSIRVYTTERGS